MSAVFAVDACRTPIGKIKGALAEVRPDHLTAQVMAALLARNAWLDPQTIDDVYWGAANQAGEDNRNVASLGFCDPDAGIAVGYVTGQMGPRWQNPRNRSLIDAIYSCV